MTRKRQKLVIKRTANLTDSMRKERQSETFEEMSTAVSKETTSVESLRQKKKVKAARTIRVQREKIIRYEAKLAAAYQKSENTHSLDTVTEPEDIDEFDKKCEESRHIGPQLNPMKFVATDVETPAQAVFVSDFDLCEAMHRPEPNSTQSKKVESSKRFEVEQKFLEELVTDIEKLLASSGRMDVELKVVKTRENNGSPCSKISLVRKMKAEKVGENLKNQRELYGFEASEIPMKDDEFKRDHGNSEVKITKNQKVPSGYKMYTSFKRLFGY
ncbi:hypothetical protein GCK72_006721 [Caenorhabditis remanei]|uniref:Uncharacterized protein n=1 Tax=Caenorhabditis remanei TaxID=31234 RepID=A0A6A5HK47_CAERE|nr:hypothetical protein GCK72_006721 [Caenorhabditis remanei]KAF1766763.1 hypothetical protein GCK72_006721 [Caenorhabditis remanei]